MKLSEVLNEANDPYVEISIGYGGHCSVYSVKFSSLKKMLEITDPDEMNDLIISSSNGNAANDPECSEGDIFFDFSNEEVKDFHREIKQVELNDMVNESVDKPKQEK